MIITTNYSSEIEAMRNNKLEMGEFGPLGYILLRTRSPIADAVAAYSGADGKPSTYTAGIVNLARLRHHQGRGRRRQDLRLCRPGLHFRPSVPGL